MANAITNSISHTYGGQEFLEKIFYTPQVEGRDPFMDYQLLDNVKTSVNMYIPGKLQKILRESTSCGFSATGSAAISDRTVTVKKVKVNLEQCEDAFDSTIFAEARKAGVMRKDLTGTIMSDIVENVAARSQREDIIKLAWMGKDADADSFYGIMDGYFQVMLDNSASLSGVVTMSTYETAEVLNSDGGLDALRAVYEAQDAPLAAIADADKKFYVARSVYNSLLTSLENTGASAGIERIQANGNQGLAFRGIELVVMDTWTEALADSANPQRDSSLVSPNAIVLTIPENLVIASDVTDPKAEVDFWYEKKDEMYYYKSAFLLGVNLVHFELAVLAH